MAPIKFEEQLKDKLEKRTLSPSAEGWSKLSDRLDADEKKSKNPFFWWLSIAAGVLIMIAVSVQFFGTDESKEVLPKVVVEKVIEKSLEGEESKLNPAKSIELVNKDSFEDKKEDTPIAQEPQILDYKKVTSKKAVPKTQLAKTDDIFNSAQSNGIKEDVNNQLQEELDNAMMENAVADALKDLKSENTSVTDREIDSLLKIASKELFKERLSSETSKIVDASSLLMSVEDEMGQSFRSKIFDALKDSYESVKTAVVQRNN